RRRSGNTSSTAESCTTWCGSSRLDSGAVLADTIACRLTSYSGFVFDPGHCRSRPCRRFLPAPCPPMQSPAGRLLQRLRFAARRGRRHCGSRPCRRFLPAPCPPMRSPAGRLLQRLRFAARRGRRHCGSSRPAGDSSPAPPCTPTQSPAGRLLQRLRSWSVVLQEPTFSTPTAAVLRKDSAAATVVIAALVALGPLATDMYLPAMPAMTVALDTGIDTVQLTLSVFLAGFAVSQLGYGALSDRFGRKPVLL